MPIKPVDQIGMDEEPLEDEELLEALELRADRAAALAPLRKSYAEADEVAKGLVKDRLEVGQVVRIGRFRVTRRPIAGRHVEFDTADGDSVAIEAGDEG